MTTPEGIIKAQIKKVLDSYGSNIYTYMPVPGGYGKSTLDYLICVDGLFVAIEAKRPGAKPTPRQEAALEDVRLAGGTTFVINCEEGVRELDKFLLSVMQSRTRVA